MIKHWLLDREWPRRYPEEEYRSVIDAIHHGDSEIKEQAILSFIPLLGCIVRQYCVNARVSHFSNDLMSAGLIGIVDAINRIEVNGLDHDNLGGYVAKYIHQYIIKCAEGLPTIRIPGSTLRAHKRRGQTVRERFKGHRLTDEAKTADGTNLIDTKDLIESVCKTSVNSQIVKLRFEGYTDSEIADKLAMNRSTVTLARHAIRDRLIKALEELRNDD